MENGSGHSPPGERPFSRLVPGLDPASVLLDRPGRTGASPPGRRGASPAFRRSPPALQPLDPQPPPDRPASTSRLDGSPAPPAATPAGRRNSPRYDRWWGRTIAVGMPPMPAGRGDRRLRRRRTEEHLGPPHAHGVNRQKPRLEQAHRIVEAPRRDLGHQPYCRELACSGRAGCARGCRTIEYQASAAVRRRGGSVWRGGPRPAAS
jgi:hypothetical protein